MVTLCRYNQTPEFTQGFLLADGVHVSDTLELPWKENCHDISCIPEGEYEIEYREDDYHHVKMGYVVKGVPGRDGILLHPASTVNELLGCVGVGVKYGNVLYYNTITIQHMHKVVGDRETLKVTSVKNVL